MDPKYTNNLPQRGRLKTKSSCKHQLGQVLFLCEIDHQAHTVCRYISQEALLKDGGAERPRSADWYPGGWPSLAGSLIANDGGRRGLRLARQAPAATDASGPADGLGRGQARCACLAPAKRKELLHSAKSTDLRSAKSTEKNTDLSLDWREPLGSVLLVPTGRNAGNVFVIGDYATIEVVI